jgi:hypothetical protein
MLGLYPPATEAQLHQTEEQLGFPLPADLRRLYTEIANGGKDLGPVFTLIGAAGGCPRYAYDPHGTLASWVSHSGWRPHPRIEEALLRHPGWRVVVDWPPKGLLLIGDPGESSLNLDPFTGRLYTMDPCVAVPLEDGEEGEAATITGGDMPVRYLDAFSLVAPSLGIWFSRWLDDLYGVPGASWPYPRERRLLKPEMVETSDLPDPEVVWRGLYRFGPEWRRPRRDDERLAAEPDEDWPYWPLGVEP